MLDLTSPVLIWAISGLVLMLAELIIPGGIVIFLGAASLLVAAAWQLAFIDNWTHALTLWFISSITLLLAFRNVTQKLVGGDTSIADTEKDADIYGKEATVTDTIGPGEKTGRVSFQDTTWEALADGSVIEAGQTVTIVCRDNIALIVEKKNV